MESTDTTLDLSIHQLVDFDWIVKGILGTSSAVAHPPPPLVEIDFHLCTNSKYDEKIGNVTQTLKLELNNQELKTLITSLEKSMTSNT